jgi:hypothetical protein
MENDSRNSEEGEEDNLNDQTPNDNVFPVWSAGWVPLAMIPPLTQYKDD